ncbi:UDP-glycosyltransferase 89A2-like [Hibiscus syriacus]|uniref:UDP-glycosyltransferase 89A2-like n=1 Tax=Hibiscus syriacus TaxID=106335 RepID=A0A6A2WN83_HIBSY|nr:UDP-glycosyltransferase 89A2-like [Hibiscus syriacus]
MDDEIARWRPLQSDWYSPRRLHDSPVHYDFPGDRFIPNRSLMDLDRAHGLLTNRTTQFDTDSSFNEAYRQKLIENMSLDSQGRPFKIMAFRGSPKSSRKPIRFVDELRQEVATIFYKDCKQTPYRCIPKVFNSMPHSFTLPVVLLSILVSTHDFGSSSPRFSPWDSEMPTPIALCVGIWFWAYIQGIVLYEHPPASQGHASLDLSQGLLMRGDRCELWDVWVQGEKRVLDAPRLRNDYYANIMSWSNNNILAVTLVRSSTYGTPRTREYTSCFSLQLWDAESSKLVRNLQGHSGRIASTAWNGRILTSGSRDKSIINHDVRAANNVASCIKQHADEVCGLKWSTEGNRLASGGNENLLYIWEGSKMSSSKFLHRLSDHCAAVKALTWCPYQYNVLASGGGLSDGCIKIWNTQKGICINSIETKAQICGLEWNRHHKEILSGHGYSIRENQNKLCLWKYPSMTKLGELGNHKSRVINLCQSPDGITVISAGADETLRFWDVFGPPTAGNLMVSDLQGLSSFRTSPLR